MREAGVAIIYTVDSTVRGWIRVADMIWIFILGIIGLAVYHEGFRKVLLWTIGILAFALAVIEGFVFMA
jgi:hypothetical protein